MSGENAFGWAKLLVLAAIIGGAYWLARKFFDFFTVGAGYNNPVKKGVDKIVSAATGRDETLGGLAAELFNGTTKAANAMLRSPPVPSVSIADNYVGDFALDTSPGITSNVGGAAVGRTYKPRV